jgi:hypothetical protein
LYLACTSTRREREDASGVDCAGCDVACIALRGATAIVMGATTVDLFFLLLLLLPSCRA